ncbi:GntR family transcriptional regulator [Phenylobacterium sp.]|uniref:GntR family transcriptional regulator n=1 Tax=Phenylobacterium sp. TaxID=1871053 RepID=UPI0035AFB389
MAENQAEPFHLALAHLRERLQSGGFRPGARITALDMADALGLSTTPVREALSRLAGEGLVEDRRGQGYFVRPLSAADIADLYRLSLAHLLIAHEPRRAMRTIGSRSDLEAEALRAPVPAVEALFRRWVLLTGSRSLVSAFGVQQVQLGPVRRLEPEVLGDLAEEAARLAAADGAARSDRLPLLRRFHAARIREAERLATLLEAGGRQGAE